MNLLDIPTELILAIGDESVSQSDLLALSRTCHRLNNILRSLIITYNIKHHSGNGLRLAAKQNDLDLAQRFLDNPHVDVNCPGSQPPADFHIVTPLETYVEAFQDGRFDTALWIAIEKGHEEFAVLLLENGADPDTTNWHSQTSILRHVTLHRCLAVLQKLIEMDTCFHDYADPVNSKSRFSSFPIPVSLARSDDRSMLEVVLDDIVVRAPDQLDYHQATALDAAIEVGNIKLVQWLLARGAPVDGVADDRFTRTPLHLAILRNDEDVVRLLLDHGANLGHDFMSLEPVFALQELLFERLYMEMMLTRNESPTNNSLDTQLEERRRESIRILLADASKAIPDDSQRARVMEILNRFRVREGPDTFPDAF
ncbi:ankyrin repeat-containing domain protein [Aspergillus varians]